MNNEMMLGMCTKNCGGSMIHECEHPVCPLLDVQTKTKTNK